MINRLRILLVYWAPVFLWMATIFLLSSIPGERIPEIDIPGIDKIVHFAEFFLLGLLLMRAFLNSSLDLSLSRTVIFVLVIASLYAAFDEWHQKLVLARTPDFFDFFADFVGLSIGIFLYNNIIRRRSCRK